MTQNVQKKNTEEKQNMKWNKPSSVWNLFDAIVANDKKHVLPGGGILDAQPEQGWVIHQQIDTVWWCIYNNKIIYNNINFVFVVNMTHQHMIQMKIAV